MHGVLKVMTKKFEIKRLGYDMMGYKILFGVENYGLSFHHLIIAKKYGGKKTFDNGAVLVQSTSHDYLHVIGLYDPEIFFLITSELIDENIKGKIDLQNLKRIRDLLGYFEIHYSDKKNINGKYIIKPRFVDSKYRVPM